MRRIHSTNTRARRKISNRLINGFRTGTRVPDTVFVLGSGTALDTSMEREVSGRFVMTRLTMKDLLPG